MLSSEFCEISKNIFFYSTSPVAAPDASGDIKGDTRKKKVKNKSNLLTLNKLRTKDFSNLKLKRIRKFAAQYSENTDFTPVNT